MIGLKKATNGWPLTGWISILLVIMVGMILSVFGWNEEAVRQVIRATARTSVALFILAFSASSLLRLKKTDATKWLRKNRRYLGVGFAVSHFLHLVALITLGAYFPFPFLEDVTGATIIGGGLAYVFLAAMTATSFDSSTRWLGQKRWKILHTAGSYYIWIIFTQSFITRAIYQPGYWPISILLLAVFGLRMWRRYAK